MYPDLIINLDNLRQTVEFLADLSPPRNWAHPESLERAADYVQRAFESCGLQTTEQVFRADGQERRNVIAILGAGKDPRVVVGAHYDVCGDRPGADDNASAVAGLLECARILAGLEVELKHTVELVAYALEEPPFFATDMMGSYVHARSLHNEGVDVKGMLCLEMIGYFTDEPNSQKYPLPGMSLLYPSRGNFIGVVGNFASTSLVRQAKKQMKAACIDVRSLTAPAVVTGVDFSDHRSYWQFGYAAVMITDTSFYRNPHYHSLTDTPDTLDYAKMGEVVKGLCYAVMNLH